MRVLHVITGLSTGGAEMMLHKLLAGGSGATESAVVSLVPGGPMRERIEGLGVQVASPGGARGRMPGPATLWRLARELRRFRPDVVQGWMYHGNLAAHAAVSTSRRSLPVLWNVRSTLADIDEEKPMTAAVIRLGARLSWLPARIVYPSAVAAWQHEAIGYSPRRRVLIPNGFDTGRFAPSAEQRAAARAALGVAPDAPVVGHVARHHPMKDHENLLRAAAILRRDWPRLTVLMVGRDVDEANASLVAARRDLGAEGVVRLLGERSDLPALTNAFDVAVSSSSWGEAFPNVLGEAMACGVPCVATDVGDSAAVVADTGQIVPPRDAERLAAALGAMLALPMDERRRLGEAARARVVAEYSLPAVVARYEELWSSLASSRRSAA